MRLRHRDHHIFNISEAGLSEGQHHKAKHQATSKAQSSLDHAIVLHAWCSWQLSTWHLAWCLRCRGSSGALSHEDQMHGRHAQAAGQEQRGVAGHFSKTRGKPHSLRCLEKSRSWNIAWHSSECHVDSSKQGSWSSDAAPISLKKVPHKPPIEEETMENWWKWLVSYLQEIFESFFGRHGIVTVTKQTASNGVPGTQAAMFCWAYFGADRHVLEAQIPIWSTRFLEFYFAQKMKCWFSRLSSRPFRHPTSQEWSDSCRGCTRTCHTSPDYQDWWSRQSKQRVLVPHHPQSHPPKFNQCNLSLVTASYLPSIMNTRYWDIRRSICRHCPSCCFMERIFGQMSPPLMDGWTSEMSCETVQSWENLLNKFFQGARWCLWLRERSQAT